MEISFWKLKKLIIKNCLKILIVPLIVKNIGSLNFRSPVKEFIVKQEKRFNASSDRTVRMYRSPKPDVTTYRPPDN